MPPHFWLGAQQLPPTHSWPALWRGVISIVGQQHACAPVPAAACARVPAAACAPVPAAACARAPPGSRRTPLGRVQMRARASTARSGVSNQCAEKCTTRLSPTARAAAAARGVAAAAARQPPARHAALACGFLDACLSQRRGRWLVLERNSWCAAAHMAAACLLQRRGG